ncbi:hypothetical protein [Nocardia carnea]|uniref:hypothetical protein n=1 Tax=Nocardia carnea TaxID=37328 RepID=UPI002457B0C7|nr:hypothetical protein [Nocardia carnea]
MTSPAHRSPLARACRAWVFALICVLLSASGHTLTSAHTLSLSTLTVATAFVAALAWAVTDRQRGLLPITVGLLAGQGLLHLWFAADPTSGHTDHAAAAGPPAEAPVPAMLVAHCLAALVCGVWLWCGERVAFSLAAALYTRILVPLLLRLPAARPTMAVRPVDTADEPAVTVEFLRHAVARRGPPGYESVLFSQPAATA